ncbi:MAG: hypothetical protein ACKVLL_14355, partial [Verrucomicrobiales bacterium]
MRTGLMPLRGQLRHKSNPLRHTRADSRTPESTIIKMTRNVNPTSTSFGRLSHRHRLWVLG